MTILYGMLGALIFLAGSYLLSHLGAGSVPNALKPLANVWVRTGGSPESFTVVLWILFAVVATAMLLFIGIPLFSTVTDLGRGSK